MKTGLGRTAVLVVCSALLFLPAAVPECPGADKAGSGEPALTEYEAKALYLYNFAKFIDWPSDAFFDRSSPIIVGVLGDDDFGSTLENIVKDKRIQEHPIMIRLLKWPADLRSCHMVYISSSERKQFRQIVESLQERSVLTVTEAEEGLQEKGILNLVIEGGRVQFEVDIAGAEKAHLRISSKLLRLARGSMGKGREK